MGKKWSKAQREKFRATMKAKWAGQRNGETSNQHAIRLTENLLNLPKDAFSVIEKWNKEADKIFMALPFEKKADLLGKL